MKSLLEKKDRWGNRAGLWVMTAAVFLIPVGWWSFQKIELHNDVENWLPHDDPQSEMLRWYKGQFGVENRILVSWDGSSLNDPRTALLVDKLMGTKDSQGIRHGGIEHVKAVITPQSVIHKMSETSRGKIDTDEALNRLEGVLVGKGKLKIKLSERGRNAVRRVKQLLEHRLEDEFGFSITFHDSYWKNLDSIELPEEVYQDDTFPTPDDHDFQISWRGMHQDLKKTGEIVRVVTNLHDTSVSGESYPLVEKCFFFKGSPIAVAVVLSDAGSADEKGSIAAIRQAAEESLIPEEALHLGGKTIAGTTLNREVRKTAWNTDASMLAFHKRSPLVTSIVVGIMLAFLLLRSMRMAVLVLIVANYTTFLAVSIVPVTHGSMNMVLVVMPTLLSVLTISAAIHVGNYWNWAASENPQDAVARAIKMARQPCWLASITTAIGMISLATSSLTPVKDFGIYSAIGCLISAVVVLYVFPTLLEYWSPNSPPKGEMSRFGWKLLGRVLIRRRWLVIVMFVAVFAAGTWGLKQFRTETKVIKFFPEKSRITKDYRFLEDELAGILPVDIVVKFDRKSQDDLNFLQRMEMIRKIEAGLRETSEISGTFSLADFFRPEDAPSEDARRTKKMAYYKKASETENRILKSGKTSSSFLSKVSKKDVLKRADGHRFQLQKNDELWRITAQVAVMNNRSYADLATQVDEIAKSVLKYHPGTDHLVTGTVPIFLRTQQAVLKSLVLSFGLAFALIGFMFVILLRSPLAGILAMIPNLFPVGVIFGLVSWFGMAIDIGTMITASVALGIAVDGTLHLVIWFREDLKKGVSRSRAVIDSLAHCGPAMTQTAVALGLGLLMLWPTDLILISRFGWMMAALIGTALVADVILLPALLAGPLGYVIQNKTISANVVDDDENGSPRTVRKPHFLSIGAKRGRSFRVDSQK